MTRVGDIVTVTCFNSHLTNFAVLVDVDGTQTSGVRKSVYLEVPSVFYLTDGIYIYIYT